MDIITDFISIELVRKRAQRSYDEWNYFCDHDPAYSNETETQFQRRNMVNYIRHNLTNYDELLGLAGNHSELRGAVLRKIGDAYPELLTECARQGADMSGMVFKDVPDERGILQRIWTPKTSM